jgi:2'-5' RNA ligase
MRCFIALEFPPEIKSKIYTSLKKEMQAKPELKWVTQENLHLTLKFLGEIPENQAEKLADELEKRFRGEKKIPVKLGGIGSFLDRGSVRVLWIGIDKGTEEIKKLAEEVENLTAKFGFPREKRPFVPHLTVARARKHSKRKFIPRDFNVDINLPEFFIREIVLYKSTLTPQGPIYEKLKVVKLNG